jgi:hypothetical protein
MIPVLESISQSRHEPALYGSGVAAGKSGMLPGAQVDRLRTDLCDTAAELDRRGRHDAADLAVTIAARLGELLAEAGWTGGRGSARAP